MCGKCQGNPAPGGAQVPGRVVQCELGYQALLARLLELLDAMKPRQLANVVRPPLPA